jgi:hypothetical protein
MVMAVAGGVALLAAGCSGGGKPDPAASSYGTQVAAAMKTRTQAMAAISDLAADPVVSYDGTLPGSATAGDVKLTVSRGGAVSGSVDLDGKTVKVYVADGTTLVNASKSYWDGKAGATSKAAQYAGKWVKVTGTDSVGFDPADVLKPATIAQRLRGTLSSVGTPAPDKVGDTDALKVPVVGGNIYITNKAPWRILKVDVPGLLSNGSEGAATGKGMELTHLDPKAVDSFYKDLKGEKLSDALDSGVNFIQSGSGNLDCKTGGSCTASVSFSTSTTSSSGGKVTAELNVTMTASGLPTKKCSASKSVSSSGSDSMSCNANFHLAPSPHPKTYRVLANYVLTAKASVDQTKINKDLDTAAKKDHDAAKKNE